MMELACLCKKLTILDNRDSLVVPDQETGQLHENCQLHKHPRYNEVWDHSYSNELGRLCQEIGMGNKSGGKQVVGTNSFHLILYSNIPHHKQKETTYTKVMCVDFASGSTHITKYKKGKMMELHQDHSQWKPNMQSWQCGHQHSIIGAYQTHAQ
jgi:hypothetical protein